MISENQETSSTITQQMGSQYVLLDNLEMSNSEIHSKLRYHENKMKIKRLFLYYYDHKDEFFVQPTLSSIQDKKRLWRNSNRSELIDLSRLSEHYRNGMIIDHEFDKTAIQSFRDFLIVNIFARKLIDEYSLEDKIDLMMNLSNPDLILTCMTGEVYSISHKEPIFDPHERKYFLKSIPDFCSDGYYKKSILSDKECHLRNKEILKAIKYNKEEPILPHSSIYQPGYRYAKYDPLINQADILEQHMSIIYLRLPDFYYFIQEVFSMYFDSLAQIYNREDNKSVILLNGLKNKSDETKLYVLSVYIYYHLRINNQNIILQDLLPDEQSLINYPYDVVIDFLVNTNLVPDRRNDDLHKLNSCKLYLNKYYMKLRDILSKYLGIEFDCFTDLTDTFFEANQDFIGLFYDYIHSHASFSLNSYMISLMYFVLRLKLNFLPYRLFVYLIIQNTSNTQFSDIDEDIDINVHDLSLILSRCTNKLETVLTQVNQKFSPNVLKFRLRLTGNTNFINVFNNAMQSISLTYPGTCYNDFRKFSFNYLLISRQRDNFNEILKFGDNIPHFLYLLYYNTYQEDFEQNGYYTILPQDQLLTEIETHLVNHFNNVLSDGS